MTDLTTDQKHERTIVRRVIKLALAQGFRLSVNDGAEITVKDSVDRKQVFDAMFTTDEDYLICKKEGTRGFVRFVYGNDPSEVINDYSTCLDNHFMEEVNAYTDTFA